jgi:hypothetical protein
MAVEPNVVGEIAPAAATSASDAQNGDGPSVQAPKPKLLKNLPSDRISFAKQTILLRCFAIGSGVEGKAVQNQTLADLAKLNVSTASVNNTFFSDAGFITKVGLGYTPCAEVVSFERAYQFNAETAGQKLAPALRRSWFGQALLPKLAVRAISEDEALGELAEACNAQPEHKPQLRVLLDYLTLGSVVERDGGLIKQGRLARDDGQMPKSEEPTMTPQTQVAPSQNGGSTSSAPRVNTTFSGGAAGALNLAVNINVDMMQMATWPPAVVRAFMEGLALVISAKAQAENSAAREVDAGNTNGQREEPWRGQPLTERDSMVGARRFAGLSPWEA